MSINLNEIGKEAKTATISLRQVSTEKKNTTLLKITEALKDHQANILAANAEDIEMGRANGMTTALLDRLDLAKRLPGVISDVHSVAALPDPVGVEFDHKILENGLDVRKRRVPIGVLGVIYESRPNVTVDVVSLALKTSNAVILRGGSETLKSNIALVDAIHEALEANDMPSGAVRLIRDTDRRYVRELLRLSDYVDMIIPRGGNSLHQFCREESTIPVITGGIGICHIFVEESADLRQAIEIIHNAKVQRPSVCNALDTLLVQESIAREFVPQVVERLVEDGVVFRVDEQAASLLNGNDSVQVAEEGDWDTEWLDLILGVRIVKNTKQAIEHIQEHSTNHSDAILSKNQTFLETFLNQIDSAAVYTNTSTRFTDGSQLGLGAEIAISTQKLHARGPMGLEELTTYKWIIQGTGQIRK